MRSLVLAVCVIAALASPSPAKEKDREKDALPFKPLQGAFFALSVPNLAESVQWYREKLGLSVVLEVPGVPQVTALEGGGLLVELLYDPSARPGPAQPERLHGVYKAGFFVKDFDSTVDELRARGVTIAFGPFPAHDAQPANVLILDNAGNLIQIFGD